MLACLDGVRFATDMGLDHITVESDCQVLVNLLTGDDRDGSPLCHLMEDLHIMLSSGRFLHVIKIPRLCNSASHALANFGMVNQRTQLWLGSVPAELWDPIQKDCYNTMFI
jgi:hypothetical protein